MFLFRSRSYRTWLVMLVLGAALGCAAFAYRSIRIGSKLCHPGRSQASAGEVTAAHRNIAGLADVSFKTRDGLTLRGWFAPPRNGVAVVLTHGLYANRGLLLPEAEVMARHGYGILLYDSRAHGESDGEVATWGSSEADDIAQAIAFVRAEPGVRRVALLGFSVGASATSRAAANDQSVGAVILYATWPSLRAEMSYKQADLGWAGVQLVLLGMRLAGARPEAIRPELDMPRIAPRPVLFISGGLDSDTPPWAMDQVFAATSPPKDLWREPNVGHGGYFEADPAGYEQRVLGFLDRAFPALD